MCFVPYVDSYEYTYMHISYNHCTNHLYLLYIYLLNNFSTNWLCFVTFSRIQLHNIIIFSSYLVRLGPIAYCTQYSLQPSISIQMVQLSNVPIAEISKDLCANKFCKVCEFYCFIEMCCAMRNFLLNIIQIF